MGRMERIWDRLWRRKKRKGEDGEEGGGSDKENDTVGGRDGDLEAGRRSGRDDGGRNREGFLSKGDEEPHEGGFVRREEELEERPQRVVVTATDGRQ